MSMPERQIQALSELRAFLDNIPALAWTALPDGSVELFNQQFTDYSTLTCFQTSQWRFRSMKASKLEVTKAKKATKRELIVVATMIARIIGTPVFSDRTEFSVTTAARSRALPSYIFHGTFPILRRLYTLRSRYAAENRCPAGLARLAGP